MSVAVAASMLVIAVYCAARLVISAAAGVPTNVLVDVAHLVMGVGMAGMFVPSWALPLPVTIWQFAFGALVALGVLTLRGHVRDDRLRGVLAHAHLVVGSVAMLLMVTPSTAAGSAGHDMAGMHDMPGMAMPDAAAAPSGITLTGVLAALLGWALAFVAWRAVRTSRAAWRDLRGDHASRNCATVFMAPVWPLACECLMSASMAAMLLVP